MAPIRTVAVIGATGHLGFPVTEELIKSGFQVRILARDIAKARLCFPQTEIVQADLADEQSLVSGLAGQDAVYLNLSIQQTEHKTEFHTESDGIKNLVQAAHVNHLKRIGYLSSLVMNYQGINGFYWWAFEVKKEAVQLIKASGISYSIFYPSTFMDTFLFAQRQGSYIVLVGKSSVKMHFISARDYANQVVRAFQIVEEDQTQEYIIQGPEAITQNEAARQLSQFYKKERLRVVTIPHWLLRMGSIFSTRGSYGAHITAAMNNYLERFEAEKTWHDLGKPEKTIRQFAEELY